MKLCPMPLYPFCCGGCVIWARCSCYQAYRSSEVMAKHEERGSVAGGAMDGVDVRLNQTRQIGFLVATGAFE